MMTMTTGFNWRLLANDDDEDYDYDIDDNADDDNNDDNDNDDDDDIDNWVNWRLLAFQTGL